MASATDTLLYIFRDPDTPRPREFPTFFGRDQITPTGWVGVCIGTIAEAREAASEGIGLRMEHPDFDDESYDHHFPASYSPYGYVPIPSGKKRWLERAVNWGLTAANPQFKPVEIEHGQYDIQFRYPNSYSAITPTFSLPADADLKMAAHVKNGVMRGLTERVFAVYSHWSGMKEVYDHWRPAAERIIKGANREQELSAMASYMTGKAAAANANKDRATLALIEVGMALEADFARASTFAQVEKAAKKYLAGTFGEDWHVADFFKSDRAYVQWKAQEAKLEESRKAIEDTHLGRISNPFNIVALKPLLKAHPRLSYTYGVQR